MTTDAERLARLEGAYDHLATRADLYKAIGDLRISLMMWTFFLISVATGVIIAVDRLAGP